jgi:hypothetical protein
VGYTDEERRRMDACNWKDREDTSGYVFCHAGEVHVSELYVMLSDRDLYAPYFRGGELDLLVMNGWSRNHKKSIAAFYGGADRDEQPGWSSRRWHRRLIRLLVRAMRTGEWEHVAEAIADIQERELIATDRVGQEA